MTHENTSSAGEGVSEVDTTLSDDMDEMVRKASTPNLATLFQRGKQKGLIKPVKDYGAA